MTPGRPNATYGRPQTVRPGGTIGGVQAQGPRPAGSDYDHPPTIEIGEGGTINNGVPITSNGTINAGAGPAHVNSGGGGGGGGHGGGWGTNGGSGGGGGYGGGGGVTTVCYQGNSCTGGPSCGGCGGGSINYGSTSYYSGSGCGHVVSGGICGSCSGGSGNAYVNYGWSASTCNSYYSYGYYDYYNYFGGSVNNCFSYSGLFGGVRFSLVYPFLSPNCQVVNIVPRRNTRVVILESDCGTFWWRVVERRTWVPGSYVWVNGCDQWVGGYWSWRVVRKSQIYDYYDCMECYY